MTAKERRFDLRELVSDERHHLSSARIGVWVTLLCAIAVGGVDIWLTVTAAHFRIPNAVYSLFGTMFMAFASWAAGPRIAQYIGPQIGQVAQGIGASNRDQPPYPTMDKGEDGQ